MTVPVPDSDPGGAIVSTPTPVLTEAAIPRPPTFPCHRTSCDARVTRHGAHCSQRCRLVARGLAALPTSGGQHPHMTAPRDTAVVHALSWLDVRAATSTTGTS